MQVSTRTQIGATVIGGALEWYDVVVYGTLAVTISKLFFPTGLGNAALLSTLAIFGIPYIVRPFGGLILGHYSDRLGRKTVLLVLVGTMTVGIGMNAATPTYATIGIAAPIVLLLARFIQGFSVSGEYAVGTAFLVEHAPQGRRFLYGSWQSSTQGAATMLAGLIGGLVAGLLAPEQVAAWGWRIPFLIGLAIGPLGLYMRAKLTETPEFLETKTSRSMQHSAPILHAFVNFKARMLCGLGITLGGAASFQVLFIAMPTYAMQTLHLGLQASFIAPLVGGAALMIFAPVSGVLADRFGCKAMLGIPVTLLLILVLPAFAWLGQEPSVTRMTLLAIAFGLLMGGFTGAIPTALADLFPVGVRATALSVSYNFGVALFGGFAPLIVTWLTGTTGSPLVPAYYAMAALFVSLIAVLGMPKAYSAKTAADIQSAVPSPRFNRTAP